MSPNKKQQFVNATERIISRHGYNNIKEWEYKVRIETNEPVLLRIWIGNKRIPSRLRELSLTAEEAAEISALGKGTDFDEEIHQIDVELDYELFSPSCDCPICPLLSMNVQLCDVRILVKEDNPHVLVPKQFGEQHSDKDVRIVLDCLLGLFEKCISRVAENNEKIWPGKQLNYVFENNGKPVCEFNIEVLDENTFKVCFHAL